MADFLSKLARVAGQKESKAERDSSIKGQSEGDFGALKSNGSVAKAQLSPSSAKSPPSDAAARILIETGLFDPVFYSSTYQDVTAVGSIRSSISFYMATWKAAEPNPIFDPIWYVTTYPDVRETDIQPLLHYAQFGEIAGRRPNAYFQPAWYREKYDPCQNESPLAHYLKNRPGPFSPIAEFDAKYLSGNVSRYRFRGR